MPHPVISIIIPCYNHGRYIDEAIQSVELYPDKNSYEIIIINDGSTDDYTNQRLNELKDKGYHVVFQENQGLGKTRNNAVKLAKGQYILPLDADNKIKPEYISLAHEILNNEPDIAVVYGDMELFGAKSGTWQSGPFDIVRLLECNYIDACAVYRKSAWEKCGGYKEDMPMPGMEDWDFWLSLAENNFGFKYINKPLFCYRHLDSSMLRSLTAEQMKKLNEFIYSHHLNLYVTLFPDPISLTHQLHAKDRYIKMLEQGLDEIELSFTYRLGNLLIKPFRYFSRLIMGTIRRKNKTAG